MEELDKTSKVQHAEMDTDAGYFSFEGSSEFVTNQTRLVVELLEKLLKVNLVTGSSIIETESGETESQAYVLSDSQADRLSDFLATIGATSHQERYAAILCWLEGNKNINEISSLELESIYKQLRIPFPQHPSQIFWDAKSRKGWFVSASDEGYYRLSDKARHAIEQKMVTKD